MPEVKKCLVTIKIGSNKFSYFQESEGETPQISIRDIAETLNTKDNIAYIKTDNKVTVSKLLDAIISVVEQNKSSKGGKKYLQSVFSGDDVSVNFESVKKDLDKQRSRGVTQVNQLKQDIENLDKLNKTKYIVSNSTLGDLREKYPSIKFPELALNDNESILEVKDTTYHNVSLGNSLKVGDQTVYLVSNYYDALKLSSYLTIRKGLADITEEEFNQIVEDKYKPAFDIIRKRIGSSTVSDLKCLQYFFSNPHKFLYSTYKTTNSEGNIIDADLYSDLIQLLKGDLLDRYVRNQYDDPFINAIFQRSTWNASWKSYSIPFETIKDIAGMFPDLDINFNYVVQGTNEVINVLDEDEDAVDAQKKVVEIIKDYFTSKGIAIDTIKVKKKKLIIKLAYTTLLDTDLTYESISTMQRSKAYDGGYYIYNNPGQNKFIVSQKRSIRLSDSVSTFSTKEDAEAYIKNKARTSTMGGDFDRSRIVTKIEQGIMEIHPNKEYSSLQELSVIEYPESFDGRRLTSGVNSIIQLPENIEWLKETVETFQAELNRKSPGTVIDFNHDSNLAILFLYEAENIKSGTKTIIDDLDADAIKSIWESISNLNKKDYLVLRKVKATKFNRRKEDSVYLQEIVEPEYESKTSYEDRLPIKQVLSQLAKSLNAHYRLHSGKSGDIVRIITNSELKTFGVNYQGVKGFVKNGIIYINASIANIDDLYHEYAHLFLGILKSVNPQGYEDLLNKLYNNRFIQEEKQKLKQRQAYQNINDYDLTEEALVSQLANYVLRESDFNDILELLDPEDAKVYNDLIEHIDNPEYVRTTLRTIRKVKDGDIDSDIDGVIELINKKRAKSKIAQAIKKVLFKASDLGEIDKLVENCLNKLGSKVSSGNLKGFLVGFNSQMTKFFNEKSDLLFKVDTLDSRKRSATLNKLIEEKQVIENCEKV